MSKKSGLIFPVLILSIISTSIIVTAGLTVFSQDLNKAVFDRKHISSESDKKWLIQTLGLWLSVYLFGLAALVMVLRIVTGKSAPASGNDPIYIATLNRIITNTIEQSIIFGGLFAPLLFSDIDHISKLGGVKVLAVASLFVVGRVLFTVGYILGSITGISSFRSLGFAIGLIINLSLIAYHFGINSFALLDKHAGPILKDIL